MTHNFPNCYSHQIHLNPRQKAFQRNNQHRKFSKSVENWEKIELFAWSFEKENELKFCTLHTHPAIAKCHTRNANNDQNS